MSNCPFTRRRSSWKSWFCSPHYCDAQVWPRVHVYISTATVVFKILNLVSPSRCCKVKQNDLSCLRCWPLTPPSKNSQSHGVIWVKPEEKILHSFKSLLFSLWDCYKLQVAASCQKLVDDGFLLRFWPGTERVKGLKEWLKTYLKVIGRSFKHKYANQIMFRFFCPSINLFLNEIILTDDSHFTLFF